MHRLSTLIKNLSDKNIELYLSTIVFNFDFQCPLRFSNISIFSFSKGLYNVRLTLDPEEKHCRERSMPIAYKWKIKSSKLNFFWYKSSGKLTAPILLFLLLLFLLFLLLLLLLFLLLGSIRNLIIGILFCISSGLQPTVLDS